MSEYIGKSILRNLPFEVIEKGVDYFKEKYPGSEISCIDVYLKEETGGYVIKFVGSHEGNLVSAYSAFN